MMEQEELAQYGAKIEFICPNAACGRWIEHYNEIPYPNLQAEKQSDITQTENFEIYCHNCGSSYEGSITNDSAHISVELDGHEDLDIEVEIPDHYYDEDDPFEDYDPPDDPHSVAQEALGQLEAMIGLPSPATDPQFTNRLLFSGAVSCFEAYLGDTLINAVKSHETVRDEVLKANTKLGEIKFSAADLAKDPNIISKRIITELRIVLYHNLKIVTALYQDAFGIHLMPSKEQRDVLFPAMRDRHDCVHRNGRDQDGNTRDTFDEAYVHRVITNIMKVIDHIECELNHRLPF